MQEGVRQVKNGWVVIVVMVAMGAAYFFLLGTSDFREPGENLVYDLKAFEDLDNIETAFAEQTALQPGAAKVRALAVQGDKLYVACDDAVVVYGADDRELARHRIAAPPMCLAAASDGTLYVGHEKHVSVIAADGTAKATWESPSPRAYLTAIALKEDKVFVADAGNRVVYRYGQDGTIQARIGEKDPARDVPGLEVPSPYLDIAINPDGELWVVNPGKLGIERFRDDGSIVTGWYKPNVLTLDGFPGCCNPTHIAFNSKGELFACEKGLVRIKQFEVTAGTFDGLVASSELFPQEQSLRDLAVDARDRILVLDPQRNAVRIFARKETPHGTTAS